jgi:hypothetical protein
MNGSDYLASFEIEMIGKHYYLYHEAIKQVNPYLLTGIDFPCPQSHEVQNDFQWKLLKFGWKPSTQL